MKATMETKKCTEPILCSEVAELFGKMYSFNTALKLYH